MQPSSATSHPRGYAGALHTTLAPYTCRLNDSRRRAHSSPRQPVQHKVSPRLGHPAAAMSDDTMLSLLQQVFDRLEQFDATYLSSDDQLLSYLHSIMLDPAQFVAGNLTRHLAAWQLFCSKFGNNKPARQVLAWVVEGIKFEFVSPSSPGQEKHPRCHGS